MGANTGENAMTKLPKRAKRRSKVNGTKRLDPDEPLNEQQAQAYAEDRHGFHLPVRRLQQSRIGRCTGPKFRKVDGWHVEYTPRFIDEYIQARLPRVVDPADRIAASS